MTGYVTIRGYGYSGAENRLPVKTPDPEAVVCSLNPVIDVSADDMTAINPCATLADNISKLQGFHLDQGGNGMNVARFLTQNYPKEFPTLLTAMVGEDADALEIPQHLRAFSDRMMGTAAMHLGRAQLIPVSGHTRVHYFQKDKAMLRGAEFLRPSQVELTHFATNVEDKIRPAKLLFLDTAPANALKIYDELQAVAARHRVGLVVDTRDEYLQRILGNIDSDPHEERYHKLRGLKLNLEEFCKVSGLEGAALTRLLEQGRHDAFASAVLPVAEAFAKKYIERGGAFILSSGAHPLYIFKTGNGTIRVRQPIINAVSPTGAGDSTIAMAMLSLARKKDITPDIARKIAAAGLATAMQPGTRLGKVEDIEEMMRLPELRAENMQP